MQGLEEHSDLFKVIEANYSDYMREFGCTLNGIYRAYIIYSSFGCSIPLKSYYRYKDRGVIEFAGLHGFNDRSVALNESYQALKALMQDFTISRIDVAFDYSKYPTNDLKTLKKNRVSFDFKHTTYERTKKQKGKSGYKNIKSYPKHIKERLDKPRYRIELSFVSGYLRERPLLSNLDDIIPKIENSIKRDMKREVKVLPL